MGRGEEAPGRPPTLPEEAQIAELRPFLVASVRRACPRWLADQAEDIVQVALLQLLEAWRKSGGNVRLIPSYVKRAGYNATVDEMRRQFRRKEIAAGDAHVLDRNPAITPPPDRQASALEIDRGIRDCLAALARHRRIALSCHLQGYSVPETAGLLGWTVKRVEHLVARSLQALRTCLERKGLTP